MIIVDANIIVSLIIGRRARIVLGSLVERGVEVGIPEPQLSESFSVLTKKILMTADNAAIALKAVGEAARALEPQSFAAYEQRARARLHARAQSDWPVLAAALAYDGGIWTNDRDFFGVGVPVWTTRNVGFAAAA